MTLISYHWMLKTCMLAQNYPPTYRHLSTSTVTIYLIELYLEGLLPYLKTFLRLWMDSPILLQVRLHIFISRKAPSSCYYPRGACERPFFNQLQQYIYFGVSWKKDGRSQSSIIGIVYEIIKCKVCIEVKAVRTKVYSVVHGCYNIIDVFSNLESEEGRYIFALSTTVSVLLFPKS